jgi:hypothetical protein
MHPRVWALALACAAGAASAQFSNPPDPDWKELEAPPPPALRTSGLVDLEVPGSSLRFGIDPASVAVGSDGIVRYVVIARSSTGTVNGLYEGLRCNTGDVKVYARHNPDSGWVPARGADWQPLHSVPNSRHSLLIARSGACIGHGPNGNAAQIVRDLRSGVDRRFLTY